MKARAFRTTLPIAALSIAAPFLLQAAPSLSITKPPVQPNFALTGPIQDPAATNGQWFLNADGVEEFRTHEFHDNTQDGGGSDGSFSIFGQVQPGSIIYSGAGTDIIGFKIDAQIINDTDSAEGTAIASDNSHGEYRDDTDEFYKGTLVATKLTAEFAIVDYNWLPSAFTPPYRLTDPLIIAENEEQQAWYCWSPLDPPPDQIVGNYYVPVWDFGDITVGQVATKTLEFSVNPAMTSSDPRHAAILASAEQGLDVFANRSLSLKISTWIDDLGIDYPGPEGMLRDSDVSVFHNIEEEPEVSHKMHYPQYPDPTGWDVRACNIDWLDPFQKVLADDFLCTSNGPITHITFWGSYRFNEYGPGEFGGITNFHLSIHKDIPANPPDDPFSKPGQLLWLRNIDPANPPTGWTVTVEPEDPSDQGWYDPNSEQWVFDDHQQYYRYDVYIPSTDAFVQEEGTIYWLDISAKVYQLEGGWGWKTSTEHWNDAAVWADLPVIDPLQWNPLFEPPEFQEQIDLAFIIDGGEPDPTDEFDWGDAPDPAAGVGPGNYQTLAANNGPVHMIVPRAPYFDDGTQTDQPDPEPDGQPNVNATGDDNNGLAPDDEDGITFPAPLMAGMVGSVVITVDDGAAGTGAGGAYVDAWIDFNADGIWSGAETIYSNWMPQGPNTIPINVPAGAMLGQTFGRFRINSQAAGLQPVGIWPTGRIPDGEVEDHEVLIEEAQDLDWGDAPDPAGAVGFNTRASSSGANHAIRPGFMLGVLIDSEPNGQPTALADGDDINGAVPYPPGDEEGVLFTSPIIPGLTATLQVTLTSPAAALLDAWMDLDGSGTWTAGDQIFASQALSPGANTLSFTVPNTAVPGTSYARFRLSTIGGLPPTGFAPDGEVEDYRFNIEQPLDWGDAPDAPYPTLLANNGARHLILGGGLNPTLGNLVDPELNGQPTPLADGDDLLGIDDEDGVSFLTPLIPNTVAQINVAASGPAGLLQCWIDANGNGFWGDPGEQVLTDVPLVAGLNSLIFTVPPNGSGAVVQAGIRFRYSTSRSLTFTGLAQDGEVEDYMKRVFPEVDVDWGDANESWRPPASFLFYPTTTIRNGAHHIIVPGMFLGNLVDPEPDGQPATFADGDDNDFVYPSMGDDEDGVFFTTPMQPGGFAGVDVIASQSGRLDAWIDFNNDGDWADSGERIFTGQPLTPGVNSLLFGVPATTPQGYPLVSRFRYTSTGAASYTGLAMDGEVEDHLTPPIESIEVQGLDWGDADLPYPTIQVNNGARHTIVPGVMLGALIDNEPDGQPDPQALGDDLNLLFPGPGDDEDGVFFTSKIVAGSNATLDVIAGISGGMLDAWIDYDGDGMWIPPEHLFGGSIPLAPGLNTGITTLKVPSPPALVLGPNVARFRISSGGGLLPDGYAPDGEVEDYLVELYQPSPTNLVITNLTFNASNTVSTTEWTSESSTIYQLESSTNLVTGPWIPAGATVLGPLNLQTDNMSAETTKFYRVTAPWTP